MATAMPMATVAMAMGCEEDNYERLARTTSALKGYLGSRTTRTAAAIGLEMDLSYLDKNGYLKESAVKRDNRRSRRHSIDSGEVMRYPPNDHSPGLPLDLAIASLMMSSIIVSNSGDRYN
jgi:hypothetical protein